MKKGYMRREEAKHESGESNKMKLIEKMAEKKARKRGKR